MTGLPGSPVFAAPRKHNIMRLFQAFGVAVLAAWILTACGGRSSSAPPIPVSSLIAPATAQTPVGSTTFGIGVPEVTTFAGSTQGYQDGIGTAAQFFNPHGLAIDAHGTIYVADYNNSRIRKITPAGIVSTLAGGVFGNQFGQPIGVAVDSHGNVYVADPDLYRIRKVTAAGVVTTLAGGIQGLKDGIGAAARFSEPYGIAVDAHDNIYVADSSNARIRRITPAGVVTTYAGSVQGHRDGALSKAEFFLPQTLAFDAVGNLYVSDIQGIHKISSSGTVATICSCPSNGMTLDTLGNLYFTGGNEIFKLSSTYYYISDFSGSTIGFQDGPAMVAHWSGVMGIVLDANGNVFVADSNNTRIREITVAPTPVPSPSATATASPVATPRPSPTSSPANGPAAEVVATIAGNGTSGRADGNGANATFDFPTGVATDAIGNIYVADSQNNCIRKITSAGVVTTVAGGTQGYRDGVGAAAQFSQPNSLAVSSDGTIYVADTSNNLIRKITTTGVVSTVAGGSQGFADGIGTTAKFFLPYGVAVDATKNVFVADTYNQRIRKISPTGVVTTLAGGGTGEYGYTDGVGNAARFSYPYGLSIGPGGTIYVADTSNNVIRKVTAQGLVTTFAGDFADETGFHAPYGIAVSATGIVYVADNANNQIRMISPVGTSTLAGIGTAAYQDGTAWLAEFNGPAGVALTSSGNVYVADSFNNRVRKIY
jgi:sugar lactone lactonase YvrE